MTCESGWRLPKPRVGAGGARGDEERRMERRGRLDQIRNCGCRCGEGGRQGCQSGDWRGGVLSPREDKRRAGQVRLPGSPVQAGRVRPGDDDGMRVLTQGAKGVRAADGMDSDGGMAR